MSRPCLVMCCHCQHAEYSVPLDTLLCIVGRECKDGWHVCPDYLREPGADDDLGECD